MSLVGEPKDQKVIHFRTISTSLLLLVIREHGLNGLLNLEP